MMVLFMVVAQSVDKTLLLDTKNADSTVFL
jgi:hypothetical protein